MCECVHRAALWEIRTSDGCGASPTSSLSWRRQPEGVYARLIGSWGGVANWGTGWGEEAQVPEQGLEQLVGVFKNPLVLQSPKALRGLLL